MTVYCKLQIHILNVFYKSLDQEEFVSMDL